MLYKLNNLLISRLSKAFNVNSSRNLIKLTNSILLPKTNNNSFRTSSLIINNGNKSLFLTKRFFYNTDSTASSASNSTTQTAQATKTATNAGDSKIQASELIVHHHHEGIVEIQLNKLDTKNALSKKLIFELGIVIDSIKTDNRVRCIIIRSMIPGVFCAGANLKERMKMSEKEVGPFVSKLRDTFHSLSLLPVPVIAAIDGAALGGGLELALACDIRVSSTTAKMGLVEAKLAIIPGAGGTQRLPRVVGVAKAKELIFTSKVLDGAEAEKIGLVNVAVQQNEQNDAAYKKAIEMAHQIIANGPIAIQMAKLAIDSGIKVDIDSALKFEELCYSRVIPTKDRIEGLNSFTEKRAPKYIGE